MDQGDNFPDVSYGLFDIDTPMKIQRILFQLISRYNTSDMRFEVLKSIMDQSSHSIYTIIFFISLENQRHEKKSNQQQSEANDGLILNPDQRMELEQLAVEKIRLWARESKLSTHNKLAFILYRWKTWTDQDDEVTKYVDDLIKDENGIVKFITAFLNESTRYGEDDIVGKKHWWMKLKEIEDFTDLKNIEDRVRNIVAESKMDYFSEKEKKAIEVFLGTIDGTIEKFI